MRFVLIAGLSFLTFAAPAFSKSSDASIAILHCSEAGKFMRAVHSVFVPASFLAEEFDDEKTTEKGALLLTLRMEGNKTTGVPTLFNNVNVTMSQKGTMKVEYTFVEKEKEIQNTYDITRSKEGSKATLSINGTKKAELECHGGFGLGED